LLWGNTAEGDWLYPALTGEVATTWLPEWEPLPHPVELV